MITRRLCCLLVLLLGCDTSAPTPASWDGKFENIAPGEFDYFTQLRVGVVGGRFLGMMRG